jgi:hypothetical protein
MTTDSTEETTTQCNQEGFDMTEQTERAYDASGLPTNEHEHEHVPAPCDPGWGSWGAAFNEAHDHRCGDVIVNGSQTIDEIADALYRSGDAVHDITTAFIHWVAECTERSPNESWEEKAESIAIEEKHRVELIRAIALAKFS